MPKVKDSGDGNTVGCLVVGQRLTVDNQPDRTPVTITPFKEIVYRDVVYSVRPIVATPDTTGAFAVRLPPGSYKVKVHRGATWRMDVPEADTARFSELIR